MTLKDHSPHHRFAHEAMATTFEIMVDADDPHYAEQAGKEAFRELDRLETKFSRYDESSDVSKINRATLGIPVAIGYDTFACLKLALFVSEKTDGAFDVASTFREFPEPSRKKNGFNFLHLCPETLSITVCRAGLNLDLGGIGKGYALDCMAGILEDWEVAQSLLIAGGSTVLAMDAPTGHQGWPVQFGSISNHTRDLNLCHQSISGSGLAVKGEHIYNPRSGSSLHEKKQAWALAPSAVLSDALSTAFMVMDRPGIESFCRKYPEFGWALQTPDFSAGNIEMSS